MLTRIAIAIVGLYLAGFVLFVTSLPKAPRDLRHIQGIVALTGGGARLDAAVTLFEKGVGERLLISGVNPAASKAELKKLTHQKLNGMANDRHLVRGLFFRCCVADLLG